MSYSGRLSERYHSNHSYHSANSKVRHEKRLLNQIHQAQQKHLPKVSTVKLMGSTEYNITNQWAKNFHVDLTAPVSVFELTALINQSRPITPELIVCMMLLLTKPHPHFVGCFRASVPQ